MENLKNEIGAFMLTCVDFEGAGYENKENTLQQAAETLWSECAEHQRGTYANKFTSAIQGLPSYINIPFYNHDIEDLMYAFGYEQEDAVTLYWSLCGEVLSNAFQAVCAA